MMFLAILDSVGQKIEYEDDWGAIARKEGRATRIKGRD
jgi:hypothetical protein